MKNGFKILDSDMHLMEPVDLWERYIDVKYKADAPRGLTSDNVRDLRMAHPDGRYWGLPASHNRNSSHHRGQNFRKNQSMPSAVGLPASSLRRWIWKASMSRCSTPPAACKS